jgi:hypothetical protein
MVIFGSFASPLAADRRAPRAAMTKAVAAVNRLL